ncbi:hypothetical protein HK407_09g14700 [Ordospora pajunii]|uniref:uncharacterized protein n=1 Tax=Ordospora pajunii TaxID=3039483 RepID=UPI0029527883|nr:uncharacterized protein HK407_09g14700 [Ordospora pajunii]KAH9410875.1 hypothetical protein HK407_09g14700 [Ordospora pajunii]
MMKEEINMRRFFVVSTVLVVAKVFGLKSGMSFLNQSNLNGSKKSSKIMNKSYENKLMRGTLSGLKSSGSSSNMNGNSHLSSGSSAKSSSQRKSSKSKSKSKSKSSKLIDSSSTK